MGECDRDTLGPLTDAGFDILLLYLLSLSLSLYLARLIWALSLEPVEKKEREKVTKYENWELSGSRINFTAVAVTVREDKEATSWLLPFGAAMSRRRDALCQRRCMLSFPPYDPRERDAEREKEEEQD